MKKDKESFAMYFWLRKYLTPLETFEIVKEKCVSVAGTVEEFENRRLRVLKGELWLY